MARLLADVAFRIGGNSDRFVLQGWAEPEAGHRWTFGRESRLRLPLGPAGQQRVLVLTTTPCRAPPALPGQAVMLALDGRLLATVQVDQLQVLAFPVPPGVNGEAVLGITHLSHRVPRPSAQVRRGETLGLMMHSVRVYDVGDDVETRSAGFGALPLPALAARFESLGQGCQFGLVQRACGVEPLGLLRFVDTTTAMLADGLVSAFAGVGAPGRLAMSQTADAQPRWRWRHEDFGLMYDTRLPVAEWDERALRHREERRLGFLQRKFAEDLALAHKICVLTRGDCLTEPEALAVWCALRLHGPNTLLWATWGDASRAGRVDLLRPGFLRGELGLVDAHGYGASHVWQAVMRDAAGVSARSKSNF